ncbi:uncharacterized protein LOC133319163 [Danaus plexippus]|uniref:uncharacterized protein LOC133319163 n=1 Tax=Danaus plexippus TaxID=13037 RepID=UPI002AB07CE2|nr:uncharacterized protein LOC133319163 [Danaus plexippus]
MFIDYIKNEKEGLIMEGWNNRLGLSNAIIDELRIDMSSKLMRLVFHAEKFLFKNKYKIYGLLFTMPICGEGDLLSFERNKNIALTMPFDILVDSKGQSFMNLKNVTYNFETKDGAYFYLTNLYYGDQAKSDYTHNYLNKNWKLITQIFPPLILDDICFKIFNAVATLLQDLLL